MTLRKQQPCKQQPSSVSDDITNNSAMSSDAMSDSQITALLRRIMPDLYFINTPAAQRKRHLRLLAALRQNDVVLDFHRQSGARLTELTLCAHDDAEPGLLSKVCGALAALRIDVRTAFIYTVRDDGRLSRVLHNDVDGNAPPDARDRNITSTNGDDAGTATDTRRADARWIALDTLLLSEPYRGHDRALSDKTVRQVRETLTEVVQGRKTVAQLLARSRRQAYAPVDIHELSVTKRTIGQPLQECAAITLRAADSAGLLSHTAAALSEMGLDIRVAQINTADGVADDIFFVTGAHGQTLSETAIEEIAPRLRAILEGGVPPQLHG